MGVHLIRVANKHTFYNAHAWALPNDMNRSIIKSFLTIFTDLLCSGRTLTASVACVTLSIMWHIAVTII